MISVVLVDDHSLIRDGLRRLVEAEPDITVVDEADSAASLRALLPKTTANVLVLDVSLPDSVGLSLLDDVRALRPGIGVLVLSMHAEDRFAVRAIQAGASGYLCKGGSSDQIIEAIRRIAMGERYLTAIVAEELARTVERRGETSVAPHEALSRREYELLVFIGAGGTIRDAAERMNLSVNTVNSYRSRLLAKMRLASNADLVHYVLRHNLIDG
ncbi:MAG: DNA-binding response regulator [Spirochaetaceae bacterium]|nr:MAG: DNA-binding response regulator [Spirochaetaceae bacterium]